MKNKILSILFLVLVLPCLSYADNFVNLTPLPRTMSTKVGELVLPKQFTISISELPQEMVAEVEKFVADFNQTTGYAATITTEENSALFKIKNSASVSKEEGYKLNVSAEEVIVEARSAVGLYYALQSIKKVLPPHVMAGVKDPTVTHYALPLVMVNDYPQFGYRGFMLDTSRHFFSVKELKRVLEVMSYYKMNRFHWHLTDDQGWRVEIKKYPKLTSVGSISDNSYMVDMQHGDYWLNQPYGPYYYTQEQVKEVVAYAKERHIEIVPEIDMPGHFCAAMAAYPEFSCDPNGGHGVVSNIGGVYSDVLNVANPDAVQFAKDILTEIMEMFPGEYIHVGGDECPTTAWERNAACIAKKEELGLQSFRELQSHFIKDMADHLQKNGRKICVWNEAISANGADVQTIKETGATVYCWTGADGAVSKAANLGLPHIYTPQVPWYINRKQSTDPGEPAGAGRGTDNLEVVYKQNVPVPNAKYFSGVQATFWSEYVAFGDYLEYLMLPRLVAIAEAGWTPRGKMNFENFCQRITADSTLYNYNHYHYGKHYMKSESAVGKVMPMVSTAEKPYWYRLVSKATDDRINKCIELLSDQSPLLETYQNKGAEAGRLWTNVQVGESDAAYDYQYWALEEDPACPGHYALVCKAQPEGSLHPVPTAKNNGGRWKYDNQTKHFHFVLADNGYGKDGDSYYYSIRCDQVDGLWLNASKAGQGYAVNLYNNPNDGNGGLWSFVAKEPVADVTDVKALIDEAKTYLSHVRTYSSAAEKQPGYFGIAETSALRQLVETANPSAMTAEELAAFTKQVEEVYAAFRQSFGYLEKDKIYTIMNAVPAYIGISIYDDKVGNNLRHTNEDWTDNAWVVTESTINSDYTQTVKVKNVQTGRYIGAVAKSATSRYGFVVSASRQGAPLLTVFHPETQDFVLSLEGKNIYPVQQQSTTLPGTICAGADTQSGNAIRPQGAAWSWTECQVVTFNCYDENEQLLGVYRRSWPVHADAQPLPPVIKNHEFVEMQGDRSIYKRTAYTVKTVCRDEVGALLSVDETACPVGQNYEVKIPELPYYSYLSSTYRQSEQLLPTADITIDVVYGTKALNGVKKLGEAVTSLEAGHSYVIYDTSPSDAARKGYRNVNADLQVMRSHQIEDAYPDHTWILEQSGKGFKVKNGYHDLYVPLLKNSTPVTIGKNGGVFAFSLNADGETWKIKGSNGVCWDGLASGALVGWNDPGHPYKIYEYYAQPYFKVTVETLDTHEKVLAPTRETLVKAGEKITLVTPTLEGYTLKEIQGGDGLNAVADHIVVKVIYADNAETGIEEVEKNEMKKGIFDLSGRKLNRVAHRGIYIINGQKVLVK